MTMHAKKANGLFAGLLVAGLLGAAYAAYQSHAMQRINQAIRQGQQITDSGYPIIQKFMAAYDQGNKNDYKHAVQTYGQLLEMSPPASEQARIHFNIGNNLFIFGLIRKVNEDGSFQDEARYAFTQAKIAYEQSLRLDPHDQAAKFNLSLLHSVMARGMQAASKEHSTMELSNLPIGLP
jgi:mxaK protein